MLGVIFSQNRLLECNFDNLGVQLNFIQNLSRVVIHLRYILRILLLVL